MLFELIILLPNNQSISYGEYVSKKLCHQMAEELILDSYYIISYSYMNLIKEEIDLEHFETKPNL